MKRTPKKLSLNRDTLCTLADPGLQHAAAGIVGTRGGQCTDYITCISCTCPPLTAGSCVLCGQTTTNLC
jgi:hypothetical protein